MAERMQEKDRLWDIGEIDVDPKMEMQDKAEVFSEQIESNSNQDDNAGIFVNLFGRLDPLSAKRRETKTEFSLYDALCGAVAVFDKECKDNGIQIDLDCSKDIKLIGWKQDIYTIMVNLLDNSLFWIIEKECVERRINIVVSKVNVGFTLDYTDSGPGISDELLESGVIFDPEFTTKPHGTGLGLSIAGEAATRNSLTLTAVQRDNGAHFILSTYE